MVERGNNMDGPPAVGTRYITEDPYGLVLDDVLCRMAGRPALLHESGMGGKIMIAMGRKTMS